MDEDSFKPVWSAKALSHLEFLLSVCQSTNSHTCDMPKVKYVRALDTTSCTHLLKMVKWSSFNDTWLKSETIGIVALTMQKGILKWIQSSITKGSRINKWRTHASLGMTQTRRSDAKSSRLWPLFFLFWELCKLQTTSGEYIVNQGHMSKPELHVTSALKQ